MTISYHTTIGSESYSLLYEISLSYWTTSCQGENMRNKSLEILFEDQHIIVVKKPAGIATQNNRPGAPDLESLIKNYLYRKQKNTTGAKSEPYLAVIHRLDQPVGGILVFAKTPLAAKNLNQQLANNGFQKHYKALLLHQPPKSQATLTNYMVKNRQDNTSSICNEDTKDAKKAILHYQICSPITPSHQLLFSECNIDNYEELTLVDICLETGRHHQIRVQMAAMGCPIYGDSKYGTIQPGSWKNIALCAYKLEFAHPVTQAFMHFEL